MRKLTAKDICDYEVEITEMDGHRAYGYVTKAYDMRIMTELNEEELEWLNMHGEVGDIIYEAGQDKMQYEGDRIYDEWREREAGL